MLEVVFDSEACTLEDMASIVELLLKVAFSVRLQEAIEPERLTVVVVFVGLRAMEGTLVAFVVRVVFKTTDDNIVVRASVTLIVVL